MKKVSITLVGCLFTISSLIAQVRTPSPSPGAQVKQTVGITDFTVIYSRPGMKGREIFGKLLAYDKIWRTGANAATSIELSTDAMIAGQKLAAGKYSIVSLPNANEWTLIFNKDLGVTEDSYSQDKDALRVKLKTMQCPLTQSFTIDFSDVTDSTANLNFSWERTKFSAKVEVATSVLTESSIDKAAEANAAQMNAGAGYLLGKGKNLDKALAMVNSAIGLKETYRNLWTKAQILAKLGNFAEALPLAKKALDLGPSSNDGAFSFFKDAITKGVEEYTSKIPVPVTLPVKKKK